MIVIPASDAERSLWQLTFDLTHILAGLKWTVIGAQMLFLHATEAGIRVGRTSTDVDFLVDARTVTTATADAAARLLAADFELDGQTIDERGMRFRRGGLSVDLLAPDGTSARTRLATTQGARTIAVPGGTQALRRSEVIECQLGQQTAAIPRPNLAGAILMKTRAIDVADDPDKHRADLCFLIGLVSDPRSLREELSRTERGWLRNRTELQDPGHRAWYAAVDPESAFIAYRILTT